MIKLTSSALCHGNTIDMPDHKTIDIDYVVEVYDKTIS